MAIIYTYPKKSSPTSADLVVISDVADENKTKQSTISSIGDAIPKVDSLAAGPGIDISATTGNVTISNIGILTVAGSVNPFITTTAVTVNGDATVGAALSATGTPSATTYLRGDNTWATPAGAGTVTNVSSSSAFSALSLTTVNPTDTPAITLDLSGVPSPGSSYFLDGTGNWSIPPGGGGTMSSWILQSDSGAGSQETVTDGVLVRLNGGAGISTSNTAGTVTIDNEAQFNSLILAGDIGADQTINDGDTITIAGGTGIQTAGAATDTINVTNTDRGSSQNIFKTVAVSGQPNVIASVNSDTLNLVAGAGITLTTDAAAQSVEFEATAATTPTTGWNPINIPSGTGFNFIAGDSLMIQVVAEATFICNKMKFMAQYNTGSGGPVMRFDIYEGQLLEPTALPGPPLPNGTWLGGGLGPGAPTADEGGIIELTLFPAVEGGTVQITAGNNYVLYFRTSGGTYNILSAPDNAISNAGIAIGGPSGGVLSPPNASLAAEITAKGFNAANEEARKRPCCHLYSVV